MMAPDTLTEMPPWSAAAPRMCCKVRGGWLEVHVRLAASAAHYASLLRTITKVAAISAAASRM